jgi:hypothetical protein
MSTSTLILTPTLGADEEFVILDVDFGARKTLYMSDGLTESSARKTLAERFGRSASDIEARVRLAKFLRTSNCSGS